LPFAVFLDWLEWSHLVTAVARAVAFVSVFVPALVAALWIHKYPGVRLHAWVVGVAIACAIFARLPAPIPGRENEPVLLRDQLKDCLLAPAFVPVFAASLELCGILLSLLVSGGSGSSGPHVPFRPH
jgi:hypothetical protein